MKIRLVDTRINDDFASMLANINKLVMNYKGDESGFIEKLKGWEKILLNLLPENQKSWYKPTANPITKNGKINNHSILSSLNSELVSQKIQQMRESNVEESFDKLIKRFEEELKKLSASITSDLKKADTYEKVEQAMREGYSTWEGVRYKFKNEITSYMKKQGLGQSKWTPAESFSAKSRAIGKQLHNTYEMRVNQIYKDIKANYGKQAWIKQIVNVLNNFKAKCKSYDVPVTIDGDALGGWKVRIDQVRKENSDSSKIVKDLMNKLESEIKRIENTTSDFYYNRTDSAMDIKIYLEKKLHRQVKTAYGFNF